MPKRRPKRPNVTGRTEATKRFSMLPHLVLTTNAYRACSPNARALLVEIVMLYNGGNNGSLYMSVRDAAARMGVSDLTAATNALEELQGRGLIVMTKEAHFEVKASEESRARCWRITWEPYGKRIATHDYLNPKAEPDAGTKARRRMERGTKALKAYRRARDGDKLPVMDSRTMAEFEAVGGAPPVLETNTPNTANGEKLPNRLVMDSATYLYDTRGSANEAVLGIGWWSPDWAHAAALTAYAASLASQQAMTPSKRRMTPSNNRAAPQILANLQKPATRTKLANGLQ
jgi:hypothetical protein